MVIKKNHSRLLSLLINMTIMVAVLYSTDIFYETNDDFGIAEMIARGYPYVSFTNYFLCRILIFIQGIFTNINIFMLSQIISSFVSLYVILRIFFERHKNVFELVLSMAVCAFFSLDHYSSLQFTKTAALVMVAGLLQLADTYTHERNPIRFASAFILFCIGAGYRSNALFPALSFVGMFMLIWFALNGKAFFKGKSITREIEILALITLLVMAPYGLSKLSSSINRSTSELAVARAYQHERARVTDFPLMSFYDECKREYDAAGLSENDLYMTSKWILDFDAAASLDNLKTINGINTPHVKASMTIKKAVKRAIRKSIENMVELNFTGMHIIIALLIVLTILLTKKPRALIYVLGLGLLTVAIYVAIYYMQREQYRALYIGDISICIWLLYVIMISDDGEIEKKGQMVGFITSVIIVLMMLYPAKEYLEGRYEHNLAMVESKSVTSYFSDNIDKFYLVPTLAMGVSDEYANPLKVPNPLVNVAATGGWETLSPYTNALLNKYGITNPIKDIINNPDAFLVGGYKRESLEEYYNKWHCDDNEKIEFVKVDQIEETPIYSVIKQAN